MSTSPLFSALILSRCALFQTLRNQDGARDAPAGGHVCLPTASGEETNLGIKLVARRI
jgi:hypothetical protein